MTRSRYILPALAVLGLVIALGAISRGQQPFVPPAAAVKATHVPYSAFIAGAGIVEPSTETISIGSPVSGIVTEINVKVGDRVEQGDVLFRLDDRALKAELLPAVAKVGEAQANLNKAVADLSIAKKVKDGGAISAEEWSRRLADVEIGKAALEMAKASVEKIKMDTDRYIVRAPMAGEILKIRAHLGEFVDSGSSVPPPMLMGGGSKMNVRVDINEYDAWRFDPDQPAIAFERAQPSFKFPLTYVRTEPYVIPKTSLTGSSTERTDSRVLQVIYKLDPTVLQIYFWQQLDVYIKAPRVSFQSGDEQ